MPSQLARVFPYAVAAGGAILGLLNSAWTGDKPISRIGPVTIPLELEPLVSHSVRVRVDQDDEGVTCIDLDPLICHNTEVFVAA